MSLWKAMPPDVRGRGKKVLDKVWEGLLGRGPLVVDKEEAAALAEATGVDVQAGTIFGGRRRGS